MTPLAAYSPLRVKASNRQADWGLVCLVLSLEGDESFFLLALLPVLLLSYCPLVWFPWTRVLQCLAWLVPADVLGPGRRAGAGAGLCQRFRVPTPTFLFVLCVGFQMTLRWSLLLFPVLVLG